MTDITLKHVWAAAYQIGMANGITRQMMADKESDPLEVANFARVHADLAADQFKDAFNLREEWVEPEKEDYNRMVPCCECGEVQVRAFMKRCAFCDTNEGKVK